MAKDLWGDEVTWWRLPGYWESRKVNLGRGAKAEAPEKGKTRFTPQIDAQMAAGEVKLRAVLGRVLFEALDEIFDRARRVEKQNYKSLCKVLNISTRRGPT